MKKYFIAASALALAASPIATPAFAQDATAMTGTMSAADVGMQPMAAMPATDYVKLAGDSDMYEIQSSKLALTKSRNAQTRGYAKQMITDHTGTTRTLMAALKNADRTIPRPGMRLSADTAAKLALLRRAPKDSFDTLYMQQQMQGHQMAWALHKGYATNGTDPALRQVASTAVPIVESHLTSMKGMMPANMTNGQ